VFVYITEAYVLLGMLPFARELVKMGTQVRRCGAIHGMQPEWEGPVGPGPFGPALKRAACMYLVSRIRLNPLVYLHNKSLFVDNREGGGVQMCCWACCPVHLSW
jgi:hypothetical protein